MKKIILFIVIFVLGVFLFPSASVLANDQVNIYFFWGEGCPHCEKEQELLDSLESKYPEVKVYDYEIYNSSKNVALLQEIARELNAEVRGVPFTVIGDQYFGGFNAYTTPQEIESQITYLLDNAYEDPIAEILGITQETKATSSKAAGVGLAGIQLPLLGEIDTANFSLPLLTIVIGALDGFNPCAMWALLFLITMLLGMKDRKRMWILGSAFIVVSAVVYFLFMAAWLNLILFLGFIIWVRILIGLVALAAGAYNLKKFYQDRNACEVTSDEKRMRVLDKLKAVTQMDSFWLALGGIVLLAAAVNLIELVCSAGLPAVYTQILALSNLATWQYYLYLLLYVFIFMLDDLFIFFIAMITLQAVGITTKYTRAAQLIGGILMVIIGILLIFKPEYLMFG